jgi:hypothetical protein
MRPLYLSIPWGCLLILLLSVNGCSSSSSSAGEWREHQPSGSDCSVLMPGTPTRTPYATVIRGYIGDLLRMDDGETFFVDTHELQTPLVVDILFFGPEVGKKNDMYLFGGVVEKKTKILIQGTYQGLDVEGRQGTKRVRSQLIVGRGGKYYFLHYCSGSKTQDRSREDKFFQSFKIR